MTWTNTTAKLGDLRPWADNPRYSTKAQAKRLLESWKQLGQFQTVAIGPECEVYDGHQRLSALLTIYGKDYEIDARQSSRALTDDERRQLVITAHVGAVGSWDWDRLSGWDVKQVGEWGMDGDALKAWNTDAANLSKMLEAEQEPPADAEPQVDRAEELREKWGTATGQLWRIGEHRLLCGDSTKREDVERVMGGESPSVVIADPPYGINIVSADVSVGGGELYNIPFGGKKGATLRGSVGAANIVEAGKYAPIIGDETTETAIKSSGLLLDVYPDSSQAWWGANHYADKLPASSCWLVWDKETTGNFSDCELAWTNVDGAVQLFRHKWNGMLRDSERDRRLHPSQKPATLAAWIMGLFSDEGEAVLDPFAGAGWVIVGAEQSGRMARAVEMSPAYCAVILERMQTAFPELAIALEG